MYYDALVSKWATLDQSKTIEENLAILNELTIAGPKQDVSVGSVIGYLALNGLLMTWKTFVAAGDPTNLAVVAAAELLTLVSTPAITVFATSDANVYAVIKSFLDALVVAGQLTQAQEDTLMAMAETTELWWKANGYTSIFNEHDLTVAGIITPQQAFDLGVLNAMPQ